MPESPNPFEPSSEFEFEPNQPTTDHHLRIRYMVLMWACGAIGSISCPTTSVMFTNPPIYHTYWGSFDWSFNIILLVVFTLGVASVVFSICLFMLPRMFDKLGALLAIALVGWPPIVYSTKFWWLFFAHPEYFR